MTASIEASAEFYTALQSCIREARTVTQLEAVARLMDTAEFDALPPQVREDIAALYAHRLYMLTGGLSG